MTFRAGSVDPLIDVRGIDTLTATRTLVDETTFYGVGVTGQTGAVASIVAGAPAGQMRLTGVTGFTAESVHRFLTVSGAASGGNNGTFLIVTQSGGTQVDVVNGAAVIPDANNGAISWVEREPYSIQDNIQYTLTDRAAIKGVAFSAAIPTYQRPTAVGTNVPANLSNIASKTTDAIAFMETRKFENASVSSGNTLITITDTGNLPHADAVDRTGVPIQDGADAANLDSCYVEIIDPVNGTGLQVDGRARGSINCDTGGTAVLPADGETVVLNDGANAAVTFEFDTNASVVETATLRRVDISAATDDDDVRDALILAIGNAPALTIDATSGGAGIVSLVNTTPGTAGNVAISETVTAAGFTVTGMTGGLATAGNRIYAFTQAGGSTEPNSVEVRFYSILPGSPISTANPYTWEASQPTTIDIFYGYRSRLDLADENAWRRTLTNGLVGDAGLTQALNNLRDVVDEGLFSTSTHIGDVLTNKTDYFVFSDLPDATPSVVEALNTLNTQIGDRQYTGPYLTDGQTITASLQALSNAIAGTSVLRVIERLSSNINAGTAHTLPGGNSYTVDGTNNGLNMWVFWRKLLRDPGPSSTSSNDYQETSTTSITPYEKIKSGDSINYMIYA